MDNLFLETKLRVPLQAPRLVARPRLVEALERQSADYKLVLVSAPAGYGKTTLLSQWAHGRRSPVVWLSLGQEDNDLERFLRDLLAGWERIQPGIRESPFGLLLGAMSPDIQDVLVAFINAANQAVDPVIFVIDDYHLIESESIHQALAYLLDHLPPNLHFVLASRGEPRLPLARYRARGEMLELNAADLSFSLEETKDFLASMQIALAHEEIEPLQARLEGWIAGLKLAVLAARRQERGEHLVVGGRHRFIADYLSEDVLASLPADTQQFLIRTSILDRLCASLCEAVSGFESGQARLESLEREGLFLIALDMNREWYRYHHLFGDYLRAELLRRNPDQVIELHQRAARWHLDRDFPETAFQHAVEGEDVEIILQIFEHYLQAMLIGGEFKILKQWLDSLPEAWYSAYPMIGFARTGFLLFTGQLEACLRWVEEVELQLVSSRREDVEWPLARVKAVRCSIACFQNDLERAETFAKQAFQKLPDEDHLFQGIILGSLGDIYRRKGLWGKAKSCYQRMLDFIQKPAFRLQSAHVYGALADLYLRQGQLREAGGYWKKARAAIQDRKNWGRLPLPLTGWVYIRMGELLYEWNEMAEAWEYLSGGLERAELGGDVRSLIAGYLIAGRLKLTEGNLEQAEAYLERARPHVEGALFAHWTSRFERFQLELWLAQDRLRAAVGWADKMLASAELDRRPESEAAQLAMARVLIVKGDGPSVERALALLNGLLPAAEAESRIGVVIEGLALEALAHERRGDRPGALTALEGALRLAEPEGYLRRFADLGLPMARLLQEARSRGVMPDYIDRLLAAFSSEVSLAAPARYALPDPLTEREEEILELLAAGLTNREIAAQLVISPGTVKKHAGNIYGKLGVGSRAEAAARARELDLLD